MSSKNSNLLDQNLINPKFKKKYNSPHNKDKYPCSNLTIEDIIKNIFFKFRHKYNRMPQRYNKDIIDNIVYNEKSHLVSLFKDQLISYDYGDYLKRYYNKQESDIRLPRYYEYYYLYSKIFPNYTAYPEGKYFYINIQKKQRMIDLQEKMENENRLKLIKNSTIEDKSKTNDNVFSTSVFNSILNGTNREEIQIIFDVNLDEQEKKEKKFIEEVNKIISIIKSNEIKEDEDEVINYNNDYNNTKNKGAKKNKDNISPLMNININYINFNKFNEGKSNSISINNKSKKKNILFDKIFNLSKKDSKSKIKINKNEIRESNAVNSNERKDYSLFVMKINQLKQNTKLVVNERSHYLKNINKKLLMSSENGNQNSINLINNKSYNSNSIKRDSNSYMYDNLNKSNKSIINNLKVTHHRNLKSIFSYKSLISNNLNLDNNPKLSIKSPLSSRNKILGKKNKANEFNFSSSGKYQYNKYKNQKEVMPNESNMNFGKFFNSSRNKSSKNKNNYINRNNLNKNSNLIPNSISPENSRFKKTKKQIFNYSILNNTIFNKNKGNMPKKNIDYINNRTIFKEKILFNNNFKNRNSSININKNDSIHSNRANHSDSSKKLKKFDLKSVINQKNMKGLYINNFLKAMNKTKKKNIKYPKTQRNYKYH